MWGKGEIRKEGEGRKEDKKAAEEYFCAEKGKKKKKKNNPLWSRDLDSSAHSYCAQG